MIKIKIPVLFVLICAPICGIIIGIFFGFTHDLPEIRSLKSYKHSSITRVYSSDSILLSELFIENRKPVQLEIIPEYLKTAIIKTEDRLFYSHSGIDIKSNFRALIKDIIAGKLVEGASTITQQLTKNLFLTSKKTIVRKIKEIILAFQLERKYTKDEILEFYLNKIYFGSGAYGVESAAKTYFGKSVQDLTLSECALIAAMPRSPSRYSPLVNINLAKRRRNIVLKILLNTGSINESKYRNAINDNINLAKQDSTNLAPFFMDYIKNFLEMQIGSSILYKGGLTVHTTLSFKLQKKAESATFKGIEKLVKRMKNNGIIDPDPQCALISIDHRTGGILAMVGGNDYSKSTYNRTTMSQRQPGSAFKTILYALAIEHGFAQNMMILDSPVQYTFGDILWEPTNFSKKFEGEMTLRNALCKSQNIPAIRLVELLGASSVAQFGNKLGIKSKLSSNLSLALGTSEVSLIDLTSAYSVFPNMGYSIKPFAVTEIHDDKERLLYDAKPKKQIVMSHSSAAIIINMLEGVVKEGTGIKALVIDRPVAGKTGTTDNFQDALFIGFSPTITTGVWVGNDDNNTLGIGETGAKAALPIWINYMKKTFENQPYQIFDIPDSTIYVKINPETGRLTKNYSKSELVLFKKGTEPK